MSALAFLGKLFFYRAGRPSKTSALLVLAVFVVLGMLIAQGPVELIDRGIVLVTALSGMYVGHQRLNGSPLPPPLAAPPAPGNLQPGEDPGGNGA